MLNTLSRSARVLIVDDTRTIRAMLRRIIETDPRLEVVGEASDPFEARDAIKRLNPDVITLDVEMPRMNGLEFLERLMRLRPNRPSWCRRARRKTAMWLSGRCLLAHWIASISNGFWEIRPNLGR